MVLVDANVLLYAVNEDAPHHLGARDWLEGALNGDEPVGFAWIVLLAFLRIATRAGLFMAPLSPEDAHDLVSEWLGAHAAVVVHPTARHADDLRALLTATGTAGNLVSDAHLAALAIEHRARVCSFDRDFGRFPGLAHFVPQDPGERVPL